MPLKLTNEAVSTLAGAVAANVNVLPIAVGDAGRFPILAEGDWFPLTIVDAGGNKEIVKVTARAGANLTVVRAQEGTTAKAFPAGARVDLRLTAAAVNAIYDTAANAVSLAGDSTKAGRLIVGGVAGSNAKGSTVQQLTIRNEAGGTTDGENVAALAFECQGNYSAKISLRADGVMGFGGGSADPHKAYLKLDTGELFASDVGSLSDPELKTYIRTIHNPFNILTRLRGVFFTWNNNSALIGKPGQDDVGLLADEVARALPEAAGLSIEDPEHKKRWRIVHYMKLIPVLIEAVKNLDERLRALEAGKDR